MSFAWWTFTVGQTGSNIVQSDCLEIGLEEISGGINLEKARPLLDKDGEKTNPYQFKLTNTCGLEVEYNINLEVLRVENEKTTENPTGVTRIADNNIAVKVDALVKTILNTNEEITPTSGIKAYKLFTGRLKPSASVTHEIRLWLDESAGNDSQNGKFNSKVVINTQLATPLAWETAKIGDYVAYTPSKTSYTILAADTGHTSDQTINPSELNLWRIIRKNDDGTVDAVSEYVSSTDVTFKGKVGYEKFIGTLNTAANAYQTSGITVASRHMGYSSQTEHVTVSPYTTAPWDAATDATNSPMGGAREVSGGGDYGYEIDYNLVNTAINSRIGYRPNTSTKVAYWVASRKYDLLASDTWSFEVRKIDISGNQGSINVLISGAAERLETSESAPVRPIITLSSSLNLTKETQGDKEVWKVN